MKFLGLKPILSLSLFVLVLLFPTLAGAEDAIHQVDIRKIEENASLSPRQKADLLIQEAEGFNNLYGAMWADEILQRALIWQPDNLKAQMYRKLIAPALVFKGILTRLDPFVKGEPQDRVQSFYKFRDQDIKGTGLGQFLTDGPRDIRTEKQMQKVFDDFIVKQDQARLFFAKIKRVKNLSFIVRYNRIKHSHSANIKKCNAWKIRPGVFARKLCDNLISRYYKVDMVDFEVFQQVMAGVKIYSALAVAYDTTGLIDHNRFTYQNQLNPEQIITRMRQVEAFGRIRRGKTLQSIHGLGVDLFAGAKWAHRLQDRLCPTGDETKINRPGFAIDHGVCIHDSRRMRIEALFDAIELALSGQANPVIVTKRSIHVKGEWSAHRPVKYQTAMAFFAPILNPVPDLKPLAPTRFNECGNPVNVGEETLGGLFPHGDATRTLTAKGELNRDCY
ncbi:MAG: hypothetical protein H6624_00110 [Bdellovibrionaceae bacterium]|nr:hypothetical protein [Bdellovibrionales bacterium]MCB9082709.1 hypothetical protein [Pseudobdellovibrionaceae bacterium]